MLWREERSPRVQKKKAYVERKVGECFQWKAHGQCSKGDSCSFNHWQTSTRTCTMVRDEKDNRPLPHQVRRPSLTAREKHPQTQPATEMKALRTKGAKFRAVTNIVKKQSCNFGHRPECQNYKSEAGCNFGRTCFFRYVEDEEMSSKKSKKGGAKGSVAIMKESAQLGCVSQDSYPRKYILCGKGKLGSQFSKGTWHQI